MVAVVHTFDLSEPSAPNDMVAILAIAAALVAPVARLVVLTGVLRLGGTAAWHHPKWSSRVLPEVKFSY